MRLTVLERTFKSFLALLPAVAMVFIWAPSYAQNDGRKVDFVSLTVGVSYDHKKGGMPSGASLRGDYSRCTGATLISGGVRFTPRRANCTGTLTVHNSSGSVVREIRINVESSNLARVVREIRALLNEIDGIQVKVVNNKVVVDGQILLPRDLNRIISVVNQYDGVASSIVTLSPIAQRKIAQFIERDINNPEIRVRAVNDLFILEGEAHNEDEKKRAEVIAQTYVPESIVESGESEGVVVPVRKKAVINLLTVKPPPTPPPRKIIQIVVHYVELNKDYNRSFRFQWTPDLADGSEMTFMSDSRAPGGVLTTITGTIRHLLPKLNWAKQHGHARVLQSSSLIVQDGEAGSISSTSKVPFPIIGPNGTTGTDFADVGISTDITPTIIGARSDSISLNTEFSLSSLIGMSDRGPTTSQNRIKTMIVVRSGQSAAIGGLITNSNATGYNKLPKDVSDNPIISLYASRAFTRNQSQFVVFITPIIKSSASAGAEQIKRKFRLRD